MGKNSGRNAGGSYSNPNSRARSRKEYEKKHNVTTTYSSSNGSKKRNTSNKKPSNEKIKVQTATMYGAHTDKDGNVVDNLTGKVYGKAKTPRSKVYNTSEESRKIDYRKPKKPEAKIIISTNNFNDLYIELPIHMGHFHKIGKQSKKLIYNFFEMNSWCIPYLNDKITSFRGQLPKSMEKMLKIITKHNFDKKKYYFDFSNLDVLNIANKDLFFYKTKHPTTKKVQWRLRINVAAFYDSYAEHCKRNGYSIPYSIHINHLIYEDVFADIEPDATYPMNSRMAFVVSMNGAVQPIEPYHKVKYVLFNNDKNKRKAMDKKLNKDYINNQFNKIVIKEIPMSTKR